MMPFATSIRFVLLALLLLIGAWWLTAPAQGAVPGTADFQAAWRQAVAYGTFAEVY